jgi:hypothetical protein
MQGLNRPFLFREKYTVYNERLNFKEMFYMGNIYEEFRDLLVRNYNEAMGKLNDLHQSGDIHDKETRIYMNLIMGYLTDTNYKLDEIDRKMNRIIKSRKEA